MTREEAKTFLLQLHTDKQLNKSEHEALRIAIEALEQGPLTDKEQRLFSAAMEMTREEAISRIKDHMIAHKMNEPRAIHISEALDMAIKALEQEDCRDAISRQAVIDVIERWLKCSGYNEAERHIMRAVQSVLYDSPPVNPQPKTGHCKDCKWWKDSDGAYRRGVGAESPCPINRLEVLEGNGYCYMFKPQESEDK